MKRFWHTLFRRSRVDADIAEEIQSHLAFRADLERQSGLSAPEARASARRKFGNATLIVEDAWELRGPVRIVDLQRTWRYWKRGPAESDACELTENGDHSMVEFRPDDAISRRWHRNPDGSEWTTVHTYDDAGRLIGIHNESSSGQTHFQVCEYDHAGRLKRQLSRDSNGSERVSESYSYDADGRKTKAHFVDLAAQRPNTNYSWGVEGSKASYSAPNTATLTTAYDQAGRPTAVLFHDAAGALVSQVVLLYGESGHLIEESQTHVVSPFSSFEEQLNPAQREALRGLLSGPTARRVHRYDALGRCIETHSSTFGRLGNHRETMDYNQQGDLIAHTSEDENREYGFDEEGRLADRPSTQHRSEARFLYEYDALGNWTSKVTEAHSNENQDFSVTSTERRTLTYFDPI
jgi:YD repeat-containing protein